MWETVVLHALTHLGKLEHEIPLSSGRTPDIKLTLTDMTIFADVTSVSDDGLDKNNPCQELSDLISKAMLKLGLPVGGLNIEIKSRRYETKRGMKTELLLPPRKNLTPFVQSKIVPLIQEQFSAGLDVIKVEIDEDTVGITVTIDQKKSPYTSMAFASYQVPLIPDRNPLYTALTQKADQLQGANGVTGIIVGDGGCTAMTRETGNWDGVTTEQIIREFFRQRTTIDFVFLITVKEISKAPWSGHSTIRENAFRLYVREGSPYTENLKQLFAAMMGYFPLPARSVVNGMLRAQESGYALGHHGGFTMSEGKVQVSLREFTEIFAGLRLLQDNGAKNVEAARKSSLAPNPVQAKFLRNLNEGRLPSSIEILKTDENDCDDWVIITFGEIDPSISPFK